MNKGGHAMRRVVIVIFFGLFFACNFFVHAVDAATPEIAADLQRELVAGIAELKIPGAVMTIANDAGDAWTGVAGVAQYPGTPMTADLNFYIASVTKTLTATIVLQLVEEGKLGLDAPLESVLPGIVVNADIITIRHLLEMRSGLGNYGKNEEFMTQLEANPLREWKPEELVAYSNWEVAKPDTVFDYNNANYILLGMIIEKITGSSYAENVRTRIVVPLGLERTYAASSPIITLPHAHGYIYDDGELLDITSAASPSPAWSAGCVVSTAAATLRWVKALVNGELLSPAIQAERMKFLPSEYEGYSYGLGIFNYSNAIGHDGNYNNMQTSWATKYKGWYVVLLCNGQAVGGDDNSSATSLFWYIADRVDFTQPVPMGAAWLAPAFFVLLAVLGVYLKRRSARARA